MIDLALGLLEFLCTSLGILIGSVVGIVVAYITYNLLQGHEAQLILTAISYMTTILMGFVIEILISGRR